MNYILFFLFNTLLTSYLGATPRISIMLDPAGDAQRTGRIIDDSFERSISLYFAEEIQRKLEKKYTDIRVILTRSPGDMVEPLQNANFANRLMVDLYISINCYYSKEYHKMHLYYFLYNPITDLWNTTQILELIPYDEAHKKNAPLNKKLVEMLYNSFSHIVTKEFIVTSPVGFPFKPLIGISSPALAIEISLQTKNDCTLYTDHLITELEPLIQECGKIRHAT
jgi:hypothetical protein